MADEQRFATDAALERALADLGAHLAYPPTPDVVGRVIRRIGEGSVVNGWVGNARFPLSILRWRGGAGVRPVLAALLVLLFAAGVVALFPGARAAVADRLGLPGIAISHVAAVP